jgi:hypothetical protein
MSKRGGTALRYDIVWTLPFSEFTRVGFTDAPTWWLYSTHTSEITAKKRFNAIFETVKSFNGSIVLFEVLADPRASTFNLRAIERAGRDCQPPSLADMNPVTVEVDTAFKDLRAKWEARNRRALADSDQPIRRPVIKHQKSNQGAGFAIGALLTTMLVAATAAYAAYAPSAHSWNGGNVFTARLSANNKAEITVSMERPRQRVVVPVSEAGSRNQGEFYTMTDSSMVYQGKGTCP